MVAQNRDQPQDRKKANDHLYRQHVTLLEKELGFLRIGEETTGRAIVDVLGTATSDNKPVAKFNRKTRVLSFTQNYAYTTPGNRTGKCQFLTGMNIDLVGISAMVEGRTQQDVIERHSQAQYVADAERRKQREDRRNNVDPLTGRVRNDPTSVDYQYLVTKAREEAEQRIKHERRALNAQARGVMPTFSGAEILNLPEPENAFVIKDLWNAGGQVLLFAPAKVGKSTLAHNVVESLTSGRPFVGRYSTAALQGRVGLIDVELEDWYLGRQLRELESIDPAQLQVWPLRGRLADFDPTDEVNRNEWATLLRNSNIEILVIDCMGPLLKNAGLDEWRDGGTWLQCVRELCTMAGVKAHLVVDHASSKAGGAENGPRGDSAKMDTPDHVWKFSGVEAPNMPGEFKEFTLQTIGRALPATVHLRRNDARFTAVDGGDRINKDFDDAYLIGATVLQLLEEMHQELVQGGHEELNAWPNLTNLWNSKWDVINNKHGLSKRAIKRAIERMVTMGALKHQAVTKAGGVLMPGARKAEFLREAATLNGENPFFRRESQPVIQPSYAGISDESVGIIESESE